MAYARNLPKRFKVKSAIRSGEPAGSAFSAGSTTAINAAKPSRRARSRVGIASLRREQSGRPPLNEQDHEDEDEHLAEHRAHRRLDDLVEPADADGGQDAAGELAHAAGDDHHERVDDGVLAQFWSDVPDLGERAAGQSREPRAQRERAGVHPPRSDPE